MRLILLYTSFLCPRTKAVNRRLPKMPIWAILAFLALFGGFWYFWPKKGVRKGGARKTRVFGFCTRKYQNGQKTLFSPKTAKNASIAQMAKIGIFAIWAILAFSAGWREQGFRHSGHLQVGPGTLRGTDRRRRPQEQQHEEQGGGILPLEPPPS